MSFAANDKHIHFNDQDNPKNYSTVLLNKYWCAFEGKPITYQMNLKENYFSPQCNSKKEIVEMVCARLYPWAEVIFIEKALVYLGDSV